MVRRILFIGWVAALAGLVVLLLSPVSSRFTRWALVALLAFLWLGALALTWRRRPVRLALMTITALCAGFLALPARALPNAEALRGDYVACLRRYEGVPYVWGGESGRGIDCSGLVRRGLVDSLFWRGVRTFDAGLVRDSLALWWNDCTAKSLGEGFDRLTLPTLETPSLTTLDPARVLPGDLAVTHQGIHVMAYLGDHQWIEADPAEQRVIVVRVPETNSAWFHTPMKLVRWSILR
jgi:cell wall-associated NlpC family hydrolase